MSKKLILASSSPRRQELLSQVKIPFQIRKPNIDESQIDTNNPIDKVQQLAALKGQAVEMKEANEVILSADTVVAFQNRIFEKPKNHQDAYEMLKALSGCVHEVYSGIMIRSLDREEMIVECTNVEFWPLTDEEIQWYLSTKEPFDKAGSYGIQGIGSTFVKKITGDYYNVVGLPLSRVVRSLREFGIYSEGN
ncbi:septum formation inhibitor Maf [Oceanobacillus piezotolerans]|uniref:dTTP/UTP pyrophosphatase n=1 Tax=Oceanobacillus piezotolerans TaxID=2448030 RepID=A0A498DGF1_9BACI|nr:Maf family protein [Oceanobacillus piezotolerans]RLL43712.1 septum formation inhibitor Maf [Oceanobacillus piezotolerans]